VAVSYRTLYRKYKIKVPSSYEFSLFDMTFSIGYCEQIAASFSISGVTGSDTRDITINIQDYSSDVNLENASVYVDGSYKGTTDSDGNINLNNVAVGDHTLRMTKRPGYLDSDLDDLDNDTFTVTAE